MPTVVGVKLRFVPKTLWFDPAGSEPALGDQVIVETERGTEIGTVTEAPHEVSQSSLPAPLKPVTRVATEADAARSAEFADAEVKAMGVYRSLVEKNKLDMKPIDVEYLFGGDKIVFYFSSEERVDFRELVRELATQFKARIDMRQVGVRDEARLVGGIGHCGQQLCCARLSGDFQPVSIRMAKEQDLPLNPLKISGLCGRLMCCLRYEYDAYKDFKGRAPKRGAIVETPLGLGKVTDLNTPKETVSIRLEDGTSFTMPLGSMSCSKGTGCPCSVSREALEATRGAGSSLGGFERTTEAASTAGARRPRRESQPGEQAAEAPAKDTDAKAQQGRRRRSRASGGSGSEGAEQSAATGAAKSPKAAGGASAANGASAGASAEGEAGRPSSGRRRRRRRSGGAKGEGGSE